MTAQLKAQPDPAVVLSKAVLNAARQLTLRQDELGRVLGVHRTAITRLKQNLDLQPQSKQGELALLLIRVARALYALAGGNDAWIRHFMRSPNSLTGGVPAEQIQTIQGLVRVLTCLDAIRGKL
ncbi:MAG: antitoxin Xre/MbcA/ParS toxin-binding domain-containing protein [Nitrincola lacisaponensis]|uniref:MbcA/ParS/Xre antitoxin family protein n=1 Tax=Nitrincola lacisaponensis TaxID=267850 RepID=UPI00391CD1D1